MLIERLMKLALFGSEWVLYLLLALSVVSFSTMFERWLFFRKRRDDVGRLRAELSKQLTQGKFSAVEGLLAKSPSIEARVAEEALRWSQGGPEAMSDAVDSEFARVKGELERGTNLLGTLGNNAPFVGLFGTVLGVIIAFHALGEAGGNTSQMGGVMAGIAESLVATGVGLFVALPAVIGYNVVQKRIGEIEAGALSLTKLLTAYVKMQDYAKAPAAEPDTTPSLANIGTEDALENEPNPSASVAAAAAAGG
ncbi:MAG: MotA/TolQ/ExbB proton channel family protein [Myxococcota bacterium]